MERVRSLKVGAEKSGKSLEIEVEPPGMAQRKPGRAWKRCWDQKSFLHRIKGQVS